ncbi:FAD-dependent oxidoreductase [Roseibium sp. SCP14]|uniref:FAD-dependent oxidoreductase n=1 Tax=Roseibium sp. SCP14 TaxID=3141375 RepID=UPI003336C97C
MQWKETIKTDPGHDYPVIADVDVLVVGGGAAGVAAAETIGRNGNSVLLVERYGFCGGGAVAGLSGTICGLYMSTDAHNAVPEQAVFGFADRFLRRMIDLGGVTGPIRYGKTWTVTHDPLVWREAADGFLQDAGVQILYHCQVVGVIMDGDHFQGAIVNSKSGFGAVHAKRIVDASGDADVIYRAGLKTSKGRNGVMQNPTMIFRLGGVDVHAFNEYWGDDSISPKKVIDQLVDADPSGRTLPRKKIWIFNTTRPDELMVNSTRILGRDGRHLDVTDPVDHTEGELAAREQVRVYQNFLRENVPGCRDAFVVDTGVEIGIRQTRSIAGVKTLSNKHVTRRLKVSDGVVRSPWPIELHSGERPYVEWLLDDYYEVPYGTLVPEVGENLIVAGRCLSSEHEALASCRVTAQCFGYGHAAGAATVRSLKTEQRYRDIAGEEVRQALNEDGAGL